jgi:RecJ-like exonuclease
MKFQYEEEIERLKVALEVSEANLKGWHEATNALLEEREKLAKESYCPCCMGSGGPKSGTPCQECKGSGKIAVAYNTVRIHIKSLRYALENIYMQAKRERNKGDSEAWSHIIRFCEAAGCKSNILREDLCETCGFPLGDGQLHKVGDDAELCSHVKGT